MKSQYTAVNKRHVRAMPGVMLVAGLIIPHYLPPRSASLMP